MFYGGSYLIYVLPALLLAMYASSRVKSTYRKYSQFENRNGYSGAEVARMILDRNDITTIAIERIDGNLTDHYDSKNKVLRLSNGVYDNRSIAALGIAAHECGHAIQDSEGYLFLKIRHAFVPAMGFATKSATPLAFLGLMLGAMSDINSIGYLILQLAIVMFAIVVVFHLVTLPVEFDASRRAIDILEGEGILNNEEIIPAKKVLNAAALTYVAAAAVAMGNLIRFVLLSRGRRR